MVEKKTAKPFKSSSGELRFDDSSKALYQIKVTGMIQQPISLTFKAYNKDGSPTNLSTTDSTLYFNTDGFIVERAPNDSGTSALKLKKMYRLKLISHMDCFGDSEEVRNLIRGFLMPSETGIQRETVLFQGKVRRILRRQDL